MLWWRNNVIQENVCHLQICVAVTEVRGDLHVRSDSLASDLENLCYVGPTNAATTIRFLVNYVDLNVLTYLERVSAYEERRSPLSSRTDIIGCS